MAEPSFTMIPFSNRRRAATTWTIGTARPSAQGQVLAAIRRGLERCQLLWEQIKQIETRPWRRGWVGDLLR
jgi:hypothetical protein